MIIEEMTLEEVQVAIKKLNNDLNFGALKITQKITVKNKIKRLEEIEYQLKSNSEISC